ncbi:MAG: serine hydrolase domain-containing protein [Spirosomataceae bacterium]
MKKWLILFVGFGIYTHVALAQPNKPQMTLRQLQDSIQYLMKQEHIMGLMVGVVNRDSVLLQRGFGYADEATRRKVDATTLFRMGSITKSIVALGILKLVEQGKIKLDDSIKEIAPEIPLVNPWEKTHPLQVVHLLEHTSGFDDIKLNRMYTLKKVQTSGKAMMLSQAPSLVCRWKPGERMAYSNPNYGVLAYLLEKMSGQPFSQFLTQTILKPIGMLSSNLNLDSQTALDTKEYIFEEGKFIQVPSVTLINGGAGALWSNAKDMTKLLQFFLKQGKGLYAPTSITDMETAHSSLAVRRGLTNGYALGNRLSFLRSNYPMRGHDGLVGTCYSTYNYNRDLGIGFVVASNTNQPNEKIEKLIVSFLQQDFPTPKSLVNAFFAEKEVTPYIGCYEMASPRNEFAGFRDRLLDAPRLVVENGKLFLKPLLGEATPLVHTQHLQFAWEGAREPLIQLATNDEGHPVLLIGGTYYEKQATLSWLLTRIGWVLAILLALLSYGLGLLSLIQFFAKKLPIQQLGWRMMPLVGLSLLGWSIRELLEVQSKSYLLYQMETVNLRTLVICGGTLLYAVLSGMVLVESIWHWKAYPRKWFSWYWLATSLALVAFAFLLYQNGWIGLRAWDL